MAGLTLPLGSWPPWWSRERPRRAHTRHRWHNRGPGRIVEHRGCAMGQSRHACDESYRDSPVGAQEARVVSCSSCGCAGHNRTTCGRTWKRCSRCLSRRHPTSECRGRVEKVGATHAEIAGRLGITSQAVSKRLALLAARGMARDEAEAFILSGGSLRACSKCGRTWKRCYRCHSRKHPTAECPRSTP